MRWLFTAPLAVDHDRISGAIAAAERRTSGRIHVLIARHRAPHPIPAARKHFERLTEGHPTPANEVLLFVAPRSRTFAVIGGRGVHEKCGDAFWTELTAAMTGYFKPGDFTAGLVHGVERAGALLAEHFPAEPPRPGDRTDQVQETD